MQFYGPLSQNHPKPSHISLRWPYFDLNSPQSADSPKCPIGGTSILLTETRPGNTFNESVPRMVPRFRAARYFMSKLVHAGYQ